jgi:hypothetical protein
MLSGLEKVSTRKLVWSFELRVTSPAGIEDSGAVVQFELRRIFGTSCTSCVPLECAASECTQLFRGKHILIRTPSEQLTNQNLQDD